MESVLSNIESKEHNIEKISDVRRCGEIYARVEGMDRRRMEANKENQRNNTTFDSMID
jgi:hypothetical protein